ncbi:prolyl oligopeptidase family serine peptidase [Sphingomonas sp. OK281]|uniref:prolyl oligopeptidase family serine peptidase n=1 Tax=Sphingomonas sp. OK281 TaxID=1881067 RepID=UPI0008E4E2A6|nr:prolyl oligopeptidase family serine peptidase [Sphingomonas sp. OK281]SFO33539.1 Predicted peptidase [Sphingomonas sp. OK281]
MNDLSRRDVMVTGAGWTGASVLAFGAQTARAAQDRNGFMAASAVPPGAADGPEGRKPKVPGLQGIAALCEVTGGGEKVYGIAVEYDADIDTATLSLDTYTASVVPAAKGFFPGMPETPDKNATAAAPTPRAIAALYTNARPALRADRKSAAGRYVIVEFAHDPDLSLPTTDSDKVMLQQVKGVKTIAGAAYAASDTIWSNAGRRGNSVVIRGVDAWEQNHWWWDDTRSAWLEYSIYLPKSFLKEGGERHSYPLVLAITHSGTSYDGTCAETLTEQCIASIWSLPEEQDRHECVVITPRYERTTMNDYWEHTADVENTYKLVQSLLQNTWNYGNPNLDDRRDKVLKIDPKRVYCTGWSMGAMTSLWLMARHPETFAAGLIIAGQQRPADVVPLAKQNLLIITGTQDNKATPWNERCVPLWEQAGGKVTRPSARLDATLIFPIDRQQKLTEQMDGYLSKGGNITFLTFQDVDHMGSARKFFHIQAARDWLFSHVKA